MTNILLNLGKQAITAVIEHEPALAQELNDWLLAELSRLAAYELPQPAAVAAPAPVTTPVATLSVLPPPAAAPAPQAPVATPPAPPAPPVAPVVQTPPPAVTPAAAPATAAVSPAPQLHVE